MLPTIRIRPSFEIGACVSMYGEVQYGRFDHALTVVIITNYEQNRSLLFPLLNINIFKYEQSADGF